MVVIEGGRFMVGIEMVQFAFLGIRGFVRLDFHAQNLFNEVVAHRIDSVS